MTPAIGLLAIIREGITRLWGTFRGRDEGDLEDELRLHMELAAEDAQRRADSPDHSKRDAAIRAGGMSQAMDALRDQRGVPWLADLSRDVRYAVRSLRRSPGFATVAVLTLALGIGVTTAVFSLVNAILVRPLPYQNSDRLVRIVEHVPAGETARGIPEIRPQMDLDEFGAWRVRITTLSHMAVHASRPMTLTTSRGAARTEVAQVSPELFSMLRVQPRLGRVLFPDDERPDSEVIVLSESAWHKYFASDLNILNTPVVLDGSAYRAVGVIRAGFDFPTPRTEFWTVYAIRPLAEGRRSFVNVLARLKNGVPIEAASSEVNALGRAYRHAHNTEAATLSGDQRFEVRRMQDHLVAPVRPAMRVLSVAAGLILLIVCANVANLLLARGISRWREIGIRRALGATRSRLVRQLLVESVVLSTTGGIAGVVIAYGTLQVVRFLAIVDMPELFQLADRARFGSSAITPRLNDVTIDTAVLSFAIAISVLTGLLFGLAPALQISHRSDEGLHQSLSSSAPGAVRNALVVGQIVLATVLLVAAGLLIHSFTKLSTVKTGYNPSNVLMFQLALPREYAPVRKSDLAHDLASRLRSLPQVEAAGFTNLPPLAGGVLAFGIFVPPGRTSSEMIRDPGQPQARSVSGDYLRALGVRLIEGRWLDERDIAGRQQVLLVNRALVRRYFDSKSPVGAHVRLVPEPNPWEIVGVVDDVRTGKPDEEPSPQFFVSPRQVLVAMPHLPDHMRESVALGFLSFAVRVNGDPLKLVPDVRAALHGLDPAAALDDETTMDRLFFSSVSRQRFFMVLLSGFAVIAAVLGAIGIYGMLAHSVVQRTKEIGIRMALGAGPGEVRHLILRQGVTLTATGLMLGVFGAVVLTRYLAGLLFGVSTADAYAYIAVVLGFAAVAWLASYVPARRATKVDPLVAIRNE
jgi:predicted permease